MPYSKGYDIILLKKSICFENPYWPRISLCLALHLFEFARTRKYNFTRIIDEISLLEKIPGANPTFTKPAIRFKGSVLNCYWHKHWTDGPFLAENLVQQWWGPYATKRKLLRSEIHNALKNLSEPFSTEKGNREGNAAILKLCTTVVEGYSIRRQRGQLTGEWIIYYVHNGKNYYLDIGFHSELSDEKKLLERLRYGCEWEFPFAF